MSTIQSCFNCWQQSLEEMVYFAVRKDLYIVKEIENMKVTIDGVNNVNYGLVLCSNCFFEPEKLSPQFVWSFIMEHQNNQEYADAVSQSLHECLKDDMYMLLEAYDEGEPVVILVSEEERPAVEHGEEEISLRRYLMIPVVSMDTDQIV